MRVCVRSAAFSVIKQTFDVLVGKLDVDDVVAGFGRHVLDLARAVVVVLALDVRLARTLHRQTQPAEPCSQTTRVLCGDRSFSAAGPRIWNSLPPELRRPNIDLGKFRRLMKTFLFV